VVFGDAGGHGEALPIERAKARGRESFSHSWEKVASRSEVG
jgi:hypothetical protein